MTRTSAEKATRADRTGRTGTRRNPERSKRAILDAALSEFSELGHDGARIDAIAERAGVSKPLIYDYFGDKDALYAAALREAYVQIREGERQLDLEALTPEQAIRKLVLFTLGHFRDKPWFISMLNTENLRGGGAVRDISDVAEIQSPLIALLRATLADGAAQGRFRQDLDPTEVYITIASLCYFPISNRHTLRAVFEVPLDDAWIDRRADQICDVVLRYLKAEAP